MYSEGRKEREQCEWTDETVVWRKVQVETGSDEGNGSGGSI